MMSQKEIDLEVLAVSSTFQDSNSGNNIDFINGIKYIRTTKNKKGSISDLKKGIIERLFRLFSIFVFGKRLFKIIKDEKPDIIHAHAMFYCGLPSIIIGKILKIPVVYEFRSLWMYQKSNKTKSVLEKKIESLLFQLEIFTLRKSSFAIFLNENLKEYVFKNRRVFQNYKIIDNAVNTTLVYKSREENIVKKRDLVFGYIGTLTAYEGIEFLIDTFQLLYDKNIKNKLIIYGDGISKKSIINKINSRNEVDNIVFKGSISPSNVYKAFKDIDVIINPRISNNVTEAVTPMKPLEAMAYKKIVIGSDVGGIKEIVKDNYNGFLFKAENQDHLMEVIINTLQLSQENRKVIIDQSIDFIDKNKSWLKNAEKYKEIYEKLIFATPKYSY